MKQTFFFLCLAVLLVAGCKPGTSVDPNPTIDPAITGTWQVACSQTIKGVRMTDGGQLEAQGDKQDTVTFLGEPLTPITSYMFGKEENIIDLRPDNKIKIYRLNGHGGVTISDEQMLYRVQSDTLYSRTPKFENAHLYRLQNDSLIIERIPSANTAWTYVRSEYFRKDF